MSVLGIVLFLASTIGYKFFMQFRLGLREEFTWVTSFSWITVLVYFFSLFDAMRIGIFVAFILGIVCLLLELVFNYRQIGQSLKGQVNLLNVFFLLFVLAIILIISQQDFRAYDDFSHWGKMAKFLFTENHLPEASDTIISFNTYPPATALFIRYCMSFFPYSEGAMLVGQFIWIAAGLYAITGLINHKNSLINLALFSSMLILFQYYNQVVTFNTLLVDFIMPVLGLAILVGLFKHRQEPIQSFILLLVNGMALAIVKNNALYFLLIGIIFFIYQLWQANPDLARAKKMTLSILGLVLPFISLLAWNIHTEHEFGDLEPAKHSMDPENYAQVFSEKSFADIRQISRNFIGHLLDPSEHFIWALLLFAAIFLIFSLIEKRAQGKSRAGGWSIFTFAQLFAYVIGIYFMYLFSMPTGEALGLAAIVRYLDSVLVFSLGIIFIYVFDVIRQILDDPSLALDLSSKKAPMLLSLALFVISLFFQAGSLKQLSQVRNDYHYDARVAYSSLTDESFDLTNDRFLVANNHTSGVGSNYIGFVGQYHLYTANVKAGNDFTENPEELIDLIKDFDYIILLDEDSKLNQRFNDLFGFQLEEGIHPIEDLPIAEVKE